VALLLSFADRFVKDAKCLGSILVTGPRAEPFFERFCEQRVALVKADGKDIMRVTMALREGKGEE
jgi:hypothetical protein